MNELDKFQEISTCQVFGSLDRFDDHRMGLNCSKSERIQTSLTGGWRSHCICGLLRSLHRLIAVPIHFFLLLPAAVVFFFSRVPDEWASNLHLRSHPPLSAVDHTACISSRRRPKILVSMPKNESGISAPIDAPFSARKLLRQRPSQ